MVDGAVTRVAHPALIAANLALLVLFPLSWFAPLMRAQLLPFFRADEISVISGLITLWSEDVLLALIVALFALVAPMVKTIALAMIHLGRLPAGLLPGVTMLGKLAMADIFLIALYIVIAKGMGVGRLEVAWGLYLFTACILMSLALSMLSRKQ